MQDRFEKRFHRLVDMLYLLGNAQPHTGTSLARRYEVSYRTILRDLEDLRGAGFPLEDLGRGRGHRLESGCRLPQNALSLKEIVPLVIGSRMLDDASLQTALTKLRAVSLNGLERTVTSELPGRVIRSHSPAGEEWLEALSQGIAQRRRILLTYSGRTREVEPWTLLFQAGHWYLHGFELCSHKDKRFRLDRVGAVEVLADNAERERPVPDTARFHAWDLGPGSTVRACLQVTPELRAWLEENPAHPSQVLEAEQASYQVRNQERFLGWVLGLQGATLVKPIAWRKRLRQRLVDLLGRY